jgi:hypothetical protein
MDKNEFPLFGFSPNTILAKANQFYCHQHHPKGHPPIGKKKRKKKKPSVRAFSIFNSLN